MNVQVYVAPSESAVSDRLEESYLFLMPPGIRSAIRCYQRWQDRQATLFGKLLLLRALKMRFPAGGMDKFQSLDLTPCGKPFIPGGPEFSISHSEGRVVLAVSQGGAVGIDIEKIRAVNLEDFSRVLPEAAALNEKAGADRASALFFGYWTKREAVLKACGQGLLAPMERVSLQSDRALFDGTTWHIRKLPIDERYCCHIATDRPLEEVAVEAVNLMDGADVERP
jgi:4'-phosphopantetheinyl transferase